MPPVSCKFGEFELDCARFELRRNGRTVKLERIPMELLILLAEKDGNVVTRQEIVERLWGKDVFVDTEHGINTAIRKIRVALREDGERPRFVQTVQGKGYRLVVEPKNGNARSSPVPLEVRTPASSDAAPKRPRNWWRVGAAATVLTIFAGALLGFNAWEIRDRVFSGGQRAQIRSIAVLPLANLSGDPSQDYFADGMTDELTTMLAKNSSLRVVSRTSTLQYKGARRPLREISRELGVDGVLEGSVERSGNRVHMTVQLIYASSDTHLWAESYDRDFNDAFSLPSELSQTIAREVKLAAAPVQPQRYINPEAHDAYLRGRYLWLSDNYDRSQEYFEKAIQLQPDYAAAWSGLADAYTVRAAALMVPPRQVIPKAKEAALKAVALDDSLPEAHNALAAIYLFGEWDLKHADEESQRAISLTPSYAEARHLRCYILEVQGHFDEAVQEQKRGMDMDPFQRPWALGLALLRARQFDAAINELRLRAEAQPQNDSTRFILADTYWNKGMEKDYVGELEKAFLALGDKNSAAAAQQAFESGGGRAVAEWDLNKSKIQARKAYVSPWLLAYLSARLRRKDETLSFLEDAYREHSARVIFLQVEPVFDFLHSDEHYRALVKKMGLPPAS